MKERKTNPDLHLICGKCGCSTMLSFTVNLEYDLEENMNPEVYIFCENCGTLTGLEEEIEDKTDWKKQLGL